MTHYFLTSFGVSGDRTTIPNTTSDGTVNYTDGYGPDYALPLDSDPDALAIDRAQMNELFFDITSALQQYQQFSVPAFITSSDNGGSAFSYSKGVRVRYDPGSGTVVYESLINSNTDLPTVQASWRQISNASSAIIFGGTAAGTANAITFSPSVPILAYSGGMMLTGEISTTNTSGVVTVNYSNIGNLTVQKSIGGALCNLAVGDLQANTPPLFFYDGTYAVLLNPHPYSHAASIATTSTLVLDTATGDYVSLTGTTTVNAITLMEGRQVTCVSGSAFTLTAGASLITPTGSSISVASGDTFVVRGEASAVVRVVGYLKKDGTALAVTPGTAFGVESSYLNLKIVWASNTTSTITYDQILAKTTLSGTGYLGSSGSFTLNLGTTGVNALDTGSLAASTFYSIYAIYNPTTNTWATLACTEAASNSEVYGSTHLPSGYTVSAYIGWLQTDGSVHIKPFTQLGRQTWFPKQNVLDVTTSVIAYGSVALSSVVPLKAKTAGGTVGTTAVIASGVAIASDTSGTAEIVWSFRPSAVAGTAIDSVGSGTPFPAMPLITAQTLYYKTQATTDDARIDISTCTF